jgi:hypothetical protein
MEGFIGFIKWYSLVLMSLVEILLIANAVVVKEQNKLWQYIAGVLIYTPILLLAIWALFYS